MTFAVFDWPQAGYEVLKLAAAYLLALPVGWYREKEAHSIGVRTFPIVSMAACGWVMLGQPGTETHLDAQSRIIQGLVTGIGFIGAGAILKGQGNVHGTATAASIWTTGVLGAAVAQNRFVLATTIAALNLIALRVLLPLKEKLDVRGGNDNGRNNSTEAADDSAHSGSDRRK